MALPDEGDDVGVNDELMDTSGDLEGGDETESGLPAGVEADDREEIKESNKRYDNLLD